MSIHRPEAEQRVIGGLLLDPSKFDEVADLVTHKDFFNGQYRSIFSAMGKVMEEGEFPEWQLVGDKLDQTNPGEEWFSILAALQKNTPVPKISTYTLPWFRKMPGAGSCF